METITSAAIMKTAPIPVIRVINSLRKITDIVVATSISVRSRIVDVEADMCFRPSNHK